jgi:hypothetical protein
MFLVHDDVQGDAIAVFSQMRVFFYQQVFGGCYIAKA